MSLSVFFISRLVSGLYFSTYGASIKTSLSFFFPMPAWLNFSLAQLFKLMPHFKFRNVSRSHIAHQIIFGCLTELWTQLQARAGVRCDDLARTHSDFMFSQLVLSTTCTPDLNFIGFAAMYYNLYRKCVRPAPNINWGNPESYQ